MARRYSTAVSLFYNDVFQVKLPSNHRFPMEKYRLVRTALQSAFSAQSKFVSFTVSPVASREELASTHCPDYIERFFTNRLTDKENRVVGFPWSQAGVDRSASSVGGTVAAMREVCSGRARFAGHIAGGTHHAFYDRGEGFCVFNDIAVAANLALAEFSNVRSILVVDLDVHQGNGTARLFQSDPRVFTFSAHCSKNYFSAKERSDIDVEIEPGTSDNAYLEMLSHWLPKLFAKSQPQLVFFQAGVDCLKGDRLGKLALSPSGLQQRNRMVYEMASSHNIGVVATMGGGYPKDLNPNSVAFQQLIDAHSGVYKDLVNVSASMNESRL
mmetsp:Transcript_8100/g.12245  ORF Transcript_8100/g.12245 Transcript_8100/m.12245 type:complete len:327 (+) Transcript_8100:67-1047(+)